MLPEVLEQFGKVLQRWNTDRSSRAESRGIHAMAEIVSLHISSSLYPGIETFVVACLIISTQVRATIGIPDSSDPEKGPLVTYPEKSAIFAVMPALNGGREGIQLLFLDMQ